MKLKKIIFNMIFGKQNRRLFFDLMFEEKERTSVINALYRRAYDNTTNDVQGENEIKHTCQRIATELMS